MMPWHKLLQILEKTIMSLDNVSFDKSEILDGNNQYTFFLNILPAIIGSRGGNSMKKIIPRTFLLDENNFMIIFSCKALYLIIRLIRDGPER